MLVTLQIDTSAPLDDLDRQLLLTLAGQPLTVGAQAQAATTPETPAAAPAKAAPRKGAPAPAKAAPAASAAPEPTTPEPEPEEDLMGGPTLSDAIARATELISSGGTPKVKAALAAVGAKRVSEVTDKSVGAFMAALDEQG